MRITEIFDEDEGIDEDLKSLSYLKTLLPQIVSAAQSEYDSWDEGDIDTYANGGICHLIADAICGVMSNNGIDCTTVSQQIGEQHVYAVVKLSDGVFSVDINPYLYETGGGYHWQKIPDVVFDVRDIDLYCISRDPSEFESICEYN